LASIAFVLAIATKLMPIVLAPLFIGRIRIRDAIAGTLCLLALYAPFFSRTDLLLGAVPNVVDRVRFNGPVFAAIAAVSSPRAAAAVALLVGLGVAIWARRRYSAADPVAWAWPMAAAILFAPVIYPWYLLCFTPFLVSPATSPLMAWTVSALSVYEVWDRSRSGGRWIVPIPILIFEFGVFAVAAAAWLRSSSKVQSVELERL
jgi:alpha-1,6-mannosyltransferase